MTFDDVVEKATIRFPDVMSLDQAENILEYIAKKLPAEIRYTSSQGKFIRSDKKGNLSVRYNEPNIKGNITNQKTRAFDSFELLSNTTHSAFIRFITIPGYDYSEHRKEVKQLWDDVRNIINKYFQRKRTTNSKL